MRALRPAVVRLCILCSLPLTIGAQQSRPIVVASKPFGESFLLAEMFAQLLESRGFSVERRPGLGATEVAFTALRTSGVDVYPEYTGTGLRAILHDTAQYGARQAYERVRGEFARRYGALWLEPLGFENTYAVAVRRETAGGFGLRTLSDLVRVAPTMVAGFTPDFIGRQDGLPGLTRAYGLRFRQVRPLAQALKYGALAARAVDIVDGYSTDGLLAKYDLVTLTDDRHFFPPYDAAALVGPRLVRENPRAVATLRELSGRLDVALMRSLNARVETEQEPIPQVARDALADIGLLRGPTETAANARSRGVEPVRGFARYMWDRRAEMWAQTRRHLLLVALALLAGVGVGVPLALGLERRRGAADSVLKLLGVIQTIPSIALLALFIPLLGIGFKPALVALWLYSLYPIVRNTYAGVRDAAPAAVRAGEAMGMTGGQLLRYVRLPLSAPIAMAGVRTAAVISVGTATLAAFVGAGGLGEPIATGLALADSRMVLAGAIPAAVLALLVDGALALVERAVTPRAMRSR